MANMTDFLELTLGNTLFRVAAAYKPADIYIGLWTTTLVDASTGSSGTEVTGGSYARKQVAQADAEWTFPTTDGEFDNINAITFVTATASWGTVTDVGICDAVTAGNMLFYKALAASKVVGDGDTFTFAVGDLDITFD